jgi:protein TonB
VAVAHVAVVGLLLVALAVERTTMTPPQVLQMRLVSEAAAPQPIDPAPALKQATQPVLPLIPVAMDAPLQVAEPVPMVQAAPVMEAPVPQKAAAELPAPPVETPPRFDAAYLNNPAPSYPAASRQLGESGRVMLWVRVSREGATLDVQLRQSSGYSRLDRAAIDAVRHWRFVPARRGNEPVEAGVLVPVDFRLN